MLRKAGTVAIKKDVFAQYSALCMLEAPECGKPWNDCR
jgi:hypothetical protein